MDFIKIPHVSNVVLLGRGGSAAAVGDIHITAHQIIFVPLPPPQSTTTTTTTPGTVGNGTTEPGPDITSGACAVPTANQEVWIFHSTVHQIERLPPDPRHVHPRPRLVVHCRDFSLFRFGMPDDARLALVYESLERLVHVDSHEALFAYALGHSTEWPPLHDPASGWHWFDLVSEYRRLGFSDASPPPAAAVPATTSAAGAIRITEVNIDYGICSTYPRFLAVPATILDSTLRHAAKHRSKGRIPAITYRHPTGAALARCSQPLVGVAANRSPQDERFIAAIFDLPIVGRMPPHRRVVGAAMPPSAMTDGADGVAMTSASVSAITAASNSSPEGMVAANEEAMHLIVDARPAINAAANTVKGSGTENMEFYKGARKEYMNIDNIHVMRDSLASMVRVIQQADELGQPVSHADLASTGWLRHIKLLMDAGQTIVSTLTRDRAHVLVHCSDGWDRTAQLMSLAQLALDPYYRTLHGFAVLIEKEWLAFGHKFTDRCGHVRPARADSASATSFVHRIRAGVATAAEAREVSPVFHQWLDAVYQLVMTYPDAFEFTPELLAALHWHAYACMAGTFLYNSDAERNEKKLRERTHSVWSMIDKDRAKYLNPAYSGPRTAAEAAITSMFNDVPLSLTVPRLRYWTSLMKCPEVGVEVDFATLSAVRATVAGGNSSQAELPGMTVPSSTSGAALASSTAAPHVMSALELAGRSATSGSLVDVAASSADTSYASPAPMPSRAAVTSQAAAEAAAGAAAAVVGGVSRLWSAFGAGAAAAAASSLSSLSPSSSDPLGGHQELQAITTVAATRGRLREAGAGSPVSGGSGGGGPL